jgi:hypothetical protein
VIPIRHSHQHTRKKTKEFRPRSSILCSQRDRDRETIAPNSISVFGEKNFLLYSERVREREIVKLLQQKSRSSLWRKQLWIATKSIVLLEKKETFLSSFYCFSEPFLALLKSVCCFCFIQSLLLLVLQFRERQSLLLRKALKL